MANIRVTTAPQPAATITPVNNRRECVPAALAMRQSKDQQHGAECAHESQPVYPGNAEPEDDGQQRANAGATRNTEHVGISERVAQQHLQQGPGQGQQAATGETGQGTRQAQAAHYLASGAAAVVDQRRQDLEGTDRDTAHHQRQRNAQLRQPGKGCENQQSAATGGHRASYFGA
jgi:hypothetical protein